MSEFASLPPVRRQDGAKIHALLAPRHCQRARNVLVPDDCAEEFPPCRCGDLTNPKKSRCTVASTKPKNVESHSPRQNRNKLIQHVRHDQTVRISGALRAWRLGGKVNALASSSKVEQGSCIRARVGYNTMPVHIEDAASCSEVFATRLDADSAGAASVSL